MSKLKEPTKAASKRIGDVRHSLRLRGFRCLNGGPFGLPSYDHVEIYVRNRVHLYLVWEFEHGGFDILNAIETSGDLPATWEAIDRIVQADDAKAG